MQCEVISIPQNQLTVTKNYIDSKKERVKHKIYIFSLFFSFSDSHRKIHTIWTNIKRLNFHLTKSEVYGALQCVEKLPAGRYSKEEVRLFSNNTLQLPIALFQDKFFILLKKRGKFLGRGGCKKVWETIMIDLKKHSATIMADLTVNKNLDEAKHEISLMKQIKSPYVMEVSEPVFEYKGKHSSRWGIKSLNDKKIDKLFIPQEKMDGTLMELISKNTLDLKEKIEILYQISLGLTHIHEQQITHNDLMDENVLYKKNNDEWMIKISDFGLARAWDFTKFSQRAPGDLLRFENLILRILFQTWKIDRLNNWSEECQKIAESLLSNHVGVTLSYTIEEPSCKSAEEMTQKFNALKVEYDKFLNK
ncbi:MAG: hypothetical protein Tsb0021_04880 [Chlamydiales bacterium]